VAQRRCRAPTPPGNALDIAPTVQFSREPHLAMNATSSKAGITAAAAAQIGGGEDESRGVGTHGVDRFSD
jgi:hypothetical protein